MRRVLLHSFLFFLTWLVCAGLTIGLVRGRIEQLARDLVEEEARQVAKASEALLPGVADPGAVVGDSARVLEMRERLRELVAAVDSVAAIELRLAAPGRLGGALFQVGDGEVSRDVPEVRLVRGNRIIIARPSQAALEAGRMRLRDEIAPPLATIGGLILVIGLGWIWWLAERSRSAMVSRLQHERLAEVGAVAAGLAHEIRNPLNSIRLNLQMLEEGLDQRDGRDRGDARLLASTAREISRLERLVEDFLRYARPRPPELRPTDLGQLVDDALEALALDLEAAGVEVDLEVPRPAPRAEIDAEQMQQVLVNLIRNAREAMESRHRRDRRLRIEVGLEGSSSARIAVVDSGPGVDDDHLAQLGSLFYSTKKGGTGLGLPVARRVLDEHGGELRFESRVGRGLRVTLRFPVRGRAD